MEVLLYLANHPGRVVPREELIDKVWRTVVNDEVLSRAISLLRTHLGDDPRTPKFVQTIPKSGYRLITQPEPLSVSSAPRDEGVEKPGQHHLRKPAAILVAGAFFVVLLFWIFGDDDYADRIPGGHTDLVDWFEEIVSGGADTQTLTAVAVLPFDDLSEDSQSNFLRDSITDELIQSLSKLQGVKVVARRSILSLPEGVEDIRTIGQYFGVDAILEGTVKNYDGRLRISVQLGSTESGFVLWSETYDKPLGDLLGLQRAAIGTIARQLQLLAGNDLSPPSEEDEPPTLEAYQAFLNGRYLMKLRGVAPLRASISQFRQALSEDPGFVRAKLSLARALVMLPFYDEVDEEAMYGEALQILDELQLSDAREFSEAESIRGFVADHRWQWAEAEKHHTHALELAPQDPNAYMWYSSHLSAVGRMSDSVKAARRGKELDSTSAVVVNRLAVAHMWVDDHISAVENYAIGAEHGFSSEAALGYLLLMRRLGRWDEMRRRFELILGSDSMHKTWTDPLVSYFETGRGLNDAVEAIEAAIESGHLPPRFELPVWLTLGQAEKVADLFEKYHGEKRFLDVELLFASEAAWLRDDKHYSEITDALGLKEYWKQYGPADG